MQCTLDQNNGEWVAIGLLLRDWHEMLLNGNVIEDKVEIYAKLSVDIRMILSQH